VVLQLISLSAVLEGVCQLKPFCDVPCQVCWPFKRVPESEFHAPSQGLRWAILAAGCASTPVKPRIRLWTSRALGQRMLLCSACCEGVQLSLGVGMMADLVQTTI
jgi:hypothetical protein